MSVFDGGDVMVHNTIRQHKYDRLDMVKKLRVTGLTQPQAEAIAEETGKFGEVIVAQIMVEIDQRGFAKKTDLDAIYFELKTDISALRTELKSDINELRTELKSDTSALRTELKGDIGALHAEL